MKTYVPEALLVSLAKRVLKLWDTHTDGMQHYDGPQVWKGYAFDAIHAGSWPAFEDFVDALIDFTNEQATWKTSEKTFRSVALDAIRQTRSLCSDLNI